MSIRCFLLSTCLCMTIGPAFAQEPLPRSSCFSGYIEILGAYISTNSQLNTDNDNRKTDSLDDSGERVNKFRPLPLGLIRYTIAEQRTQLFMGVLPENVAQGQFLVEAGARHVLSNGTGLRASVIPVTPLEQKTWKDPFGFKNFRIDWFNAFFKSNSNIDFYDSSNFITAIGLGYSF